jgi:hypothetical protein
MRCGGLPNRSAPAKDLLLRTSGPLSDADLCHRTRAETFWYVLSWIAFGVGYFRKIPMRKALSDAGVLPMSDAGQFWYVLSCIAFGAGYFAKFPRKKALSELAHILRPSFRRLTATH